jgi:hypothetical protein
MEKWIDKRGNEVHADMVRVDEKLKSEMLSSILTKVFKVKEEKERVLKEINDEIEGYMNLLRDVYRIPTKENKGNLTLVNFSGTIKVQKAVSEVIELNEKLILAKENIDAFLKQETTSSSSTIKTLVAKIFEVDKKGSVNTRQILSLRTYDIDNPLWNEAMTLIDEAITITGTKQYIRFYHRPTPKDEWEAIAL